MFHPLESGQARNGFDQQRQAEVMLSDLQLWVIQVHAVSSPSHGTLPLGSQPPCWEQLKPLPGESTWRCWVQPWSHPSPGTIDVKEETSRPFWPPGGWDFHWSSLIGVVNGAETRHPHCSLSEFPAQRICKYNKMVVVLFYKVLGWFVIEHYINMSVYVGLPA